MGGGIPCMSVSAGCVLWVELLVLAFCSHLPCSILVVRDILAWDMGASQQGVLSVAPAVTDNSICQFWVVYEVAGIGGVRMEEWAHDPVEWGFSWW